MSDPSDDENFSNSDSDFNIEDCQDQDDSDDSSNELTSDVKVNEEQPDDDLPPVDDYEDDKREYVGPVLPGGHRFDRKFICIKYPGNVINPDKAIETLGGLPSISTAVNTRNRRLELRFRPDDGYCKPACGDRHTTTGFLLRIKIRRKKARSSEGITEQKECRSHVVEVMNLGTMQKNNCTSDTCPVGVQEKSQSSQRDSENCENVAESSGCRQETEPRLDVRNENNSKTEVEVENLINELANKIGNCSVKSEGDLNRTPIETNNMNMDVDLDPEDVLSEEIHAQKEGSENQSVVPEVDSNQNDASLEEKCPNNENLTSQPKLPLTSEEVGNFGDASLDENRMKESMSTTFDKSKYQDWSQDEDYELPELKVLGQVDTEFKFMNLCDFQFLPMTPSRKNPKEYECIYNEIYPVNVPPYRWLKNKVPYFLPPAAFSRMDNVQQYVPKTETDTLPENIIGKTRKRRAGFSNFVHFHTPGVPTQPPKGIETAMKVKFLQNFHLERVRKFFEQRPVWSKNALMFQTKFSGEQLKILLPSVAYYFMTGPWRIMWVKLGYDPRKDPSSRKYQTLDYRLKAMHGLESTIKCKRSYSNYILPYKSAPNSKPRTTVLTANLPEQSQKKERHFNENVYIYREGMVPPSRQMFYQYCDVLAEEIQEMLAKLPDPAPGSKCHEKMGWLPSGFDDQCREIVNKQVRAVLRKQMNIPEDHPTKLPRKRKYQSRLKLEKLRNKKSKGSHFLNPNSSSIHMEIIPEGSDEEWQDDIDYSKPGTSYQEP